MYGKLVPFLKFSIAAAILGWLFYQNQQPLRVLLVREKNIYYLGASLLSMLVAVCLSFVRWFLLVRALQIPFSLRAAFRYGFIGYLFNFVGPSAVGGDLFKAYLLARNQKERRAEAVATILLDRVVGLFSLLLVATIAVLVTRPTQLAELGQFLKLVILATIGAILVVLVLLLPGRHTHRLMHQLSALPLVGGITARVTAALELYRQRRGALLLILLVSVVSHICIALTIRFADLAIFADTPRLTEHLIISPLASVAAAAPLPGGMGTFELAMDYLYSHLPQIPTEPGQGLSVAVIYRLVTVCVAIVGVVYYFANKSTVSDASAQVAEDLDASSP